MLEYNEIADLHTSQPLRQSMWSKLYKEHKMSLKQLRKVIWTDLVKPVRYTDREHLDIMYTRYNIRNLTNTAFSTEQNVRYCKLSDKNRHGELENEVWSETTKQWIGDMIDNEKGRLRTIIETWPISAYWSVVTEEGQSNE